MSRNPGEIVDYAPPRSLSVYQKASILVVRLYTFILFVHGVVELAEEGYLSAAGHPDPYGRERIVAAAVWLVVGGIGMLVSQALGRWLGRGLG